MKALPHLEEVAELGESPVWDDEEEVLWWIDWARGFVYRTNVVSRVSKVFSVGPTVSAVALSSGGRVVLALQHGFAELDSRTGRVRPLTRAEPPETATRMCEGKCDASGRFWAGTIALDERSPIAALFVMDVDGRVRRALDGVVCSNGLCWSEDNTMLYYVDSATQRIDSFQFDLKQGTIANRECVVEIPLGEGIPDGLTIDREGCLWVALWDGWQVRRYSSSGELDAIVEVPVGRPTSCTLGGADLRDLYITTAMPDSRDERRNQLAAGTVFRTRVDVPGLPTHRCRCAMPYERGG